MKSIAVVGGGISSIGAIARIADLLDQTDTNAELRVDQYLAAMPGAELRTGGSTFQLPNSDERGYLNRWGAVLGLKIVDAPAFDAFRRMFVDKEDLDHFGCGVENELLSYESEEVPYLCLDRRVALDKALQLVASVESRGVLRRIDSEIQKIDRSAGAWQLRTASSVINAQYDCIVMCAGAIYTPTLLFNSNLIGLCSSYSLKDHVIQFGGVGDQEPQNTLYPKLRNIQVVRSKLTESGYSHDVQVVRRFAFRPEYMASLYWRIAGRTLFELVTKRQTRLIAQLSSAVMGGASFRPDSQDFRITVFDGGSCRVKLRIQNSKPVIEWSSFLQPEAVSAFHFHASLNDCPDIQDLAGAGLYIGDLSLSKSLKGINNGCASFQAGFVAMESALGFDVSSIGG